MKRHSFACNQYPIVQRVCADCTIVVGVFRTVGCEKGGNLQRRQNSHTLHTGGCERGIYRLYPHSASLMYMYGTKDTMQFVLDNGVTELRGTIRLHQSEGRE